MARSRTKPRKRSKPGVKKRHHSFAHHTKRTIHNDTFLAFVINLEPLLPNTEIVVKRESITNLLRDVNRALNGIITVSSLNELVFYDPEMGGKWQYLDEAMLEKIPESTTSVDVWINTDKLFDQTAQTFVSLSSSSSNSSGYTTQLLSFARQHCPCQADAHTGMLVATLDQVLMPLTVVMVTTSIVAALRSNSVEDMKMLASLPLFSIPNLPNLPNLPPDLDDNIILPLVDVVVNLFKAHLSTIDKNRTRGFVLNEAEFKLLKHVMTWLNELSSSSQFVNTLLTAFPPIEVYKNDKVVKQFVEKYGMDAIRARAKSKSVATTTFADAEYIKKIVDQIVHPDLYFGNFYVNWLDNLTNPVDMYLQWVRTNPRNDRTFHNAYVNGKLSKIPPKVMWTTLPAGDESDELLEMLDALPKKGINSFSPINGQTALSNAYHQRLPRLFAKLVRLGALDQTVDDEICANDDEEFQQFVQKCSATSLNVDALHRAYTTRDTAKFVRILSKNNNLLTMKQGKTGETVLDMICRDGNAEFLAFAKWYSPSAECLSSSITTDMPTLQAAYFSEPYHRRFTRSEYTVKRPVSRSQRSLLSRAASYIGLTSPPQLGGFYFGQNLTVNKFSGPVSVYLLQSTAHPDLPVVLLMGDYHNSYRRMCGGDCGGEKGCVDLRRPEFFHALDKLDYADKISVFTEFYDWDPQGTDQRNPEKWILEDGFDGGVLGDFFQYATPCMRPVHRRKAHPKPCEFNRIKWHMGDARFGGLRDSPSIEMANLLFAPEFTDNSNYVRQYARENPHYRRVIVKIFSSLYDIPKRRLDLDGFVDTFVDEILKEENKGMSLIAKQVRKQTIPITAKTVKNMLMTSLTFQLDFMGRNWLNSFEENLFVNFFIDKNGAPDWESILFKQSSIPSGLYWTSFFSAILDLYVLLRMVKSTHDSRLAIGFFGDAHTTNLDLLLRQYYGYETIYAQNASELGVFPSRCIEIVDNVNVEEMVKKVMPRSDSSSDSRLSSIPSSSKFGKKSHQHSPKKVYKKGRKLAKSCKRTVRKSRK